MGAAEEMEFILKQQEEYMSRIPLVFKFLTLVWFATTNSKSAAEIK